MGRQSTAMLGAVVALWCSGCATVSTSSTQTMQVVALDARDRPVVGLRCKLSNSGGEQTVTTPATEVNVRRSSSPLLIECRRGNEVAMGTVMPRRERLEQALLPFGAVAVAVDHMTGNLYAYPTVVRLRLGQHLRYEFSTEARASELIETVGDSLIADTQGRPRQVPLPAAAPARAPAVRPVPAPAAAPATPETATRPSAPVNW